jgi:hypothetical protein
MLGPDFSCGDALVARGVERTAVSARAQHGAPRSAPSRFASAGAEGSRALCFGSNPADTRTASPTPGLGRTSIG